jgi:solute carrier family 50 protein (sugar transporter)
MNLSALPSIYLICKRKSTLLFPPFPFVFGSLAALVGVTYAILTQQKVVLASTSATLTFNLIYLGVHLRFSAQRRRIIKIFLLMLSTELVLTGIAPGVYCGIQGIPECKLFVVNWLGVTCAIVYALVYCGQLTTFKQVIKTKNSASISPWLTGGVLFASSMWTWYAILVSDYFYLTSSIVGDLSAITQITLLIMYPSIQPSVIPESVQSHPPNTGEAGGNRIVIDENA